MPEGSHGDLLRQGKGLRRDHEDPAEYTEKLWEECLLPSKFIPAQLRREDPFESSRRICAMPSVFLMCEAWIFRER